MLRSFLERCVTFVEFVTMVQAVVFFCPVLTVSLNFKTMRLHVDMSGFFLSKICFDDSRSLQQIPFNWSSSSLQYLIVSFHVKTVRAHVEFVQEVGSLLRKWRSTVGSRSNPYLPSCRRIGDCCLVDAVMILHDVNRCTWNASSVSLCNVYVATGNRYSYVMIMFVSMRALPTVCPRWLVNSTHNLLLSLRVIQPSDLWASVPKRSDLHGEAPIWSARRSRTLFKYRVRSTDHHFQDHSIHQSRPWIQLRLVHCLCGRYCDYVLTLCVRLRMIWESQSINDLGRISQQEWLSSNGYDQC